MSYLTWFAVALLLLILTYGHLSFQRRRRAARAARARPDTRVDLGCPENDGLLEYLKRIPSDVGLPPAELLESEPIALRRQLKDTVRRRTEGETLEVLWEEWNNNLPEDCRSIVYGSPVLVHPATGILFAVAVGRGCWAIRLPKKAKSAREDQIPSAHDLSDWAMDVAGFGEGWCAFPTLSSCHAAYEYA